MAWGMWIVSFSFLPIRFININDFTLYRPIPDQGNTAEIVLTALHHNGFGVDEFLGRVAIPLNTLDIYERPKNKWYALEAKPGKKLIII